MSLLRRNPEHEASEIEVKADEIDGPEYFPGRKTDGRNRSHAKGNIEITVRKQHSGTHDKGKRPPAGTVLTASGKNSRAIIEARRIQKVRKSKDGTGRDSTTASGGVEIFGRLKAIMHPANDGRRPSGKGGREK